MYDILVIGSGLAATSFLARLKIKNRKVGLISPSYLNKKDSKKSIKLKEHLTENLPPRFLKKNVLSVEKYFDKNRIILDDNVSIFGCLNHGGVSKYWGGSCEFLNEKNINFLNQKNKKIFLNLSSSLYSDYNFSGYKHFKKKEEKNYNLNLNSVFEKIINNYSNKQFNFFKNCNAENYMTKQILSPNMLIKNKTNLIKLNFFVSKIKKAKNFYLVFCENDKKKIILKTKKLILAAGTISSTKLVCEMLNIKKSIKIFHNPMLFGIFVLKDKIKLDNFSSSKLACKILSKTNEKSSSVNFRSSNNSIKNKIFNDFFFMKNFFSRKIYNYFEQNFLYFNLYIDSSFSNIKLKLIKNNRAKIHTNTIKNLVIKKQLLKKSNSLFKYLSKKKLIFPFKYNVIPKIGHDNHYIGTIPINGKDKILTLNENCELKNHKNLLIIDGCAIPASKSKFPTGLIIANAMRIGSKS